MGDFSLYKRLREFGTIAECPLDIPDVKFALPSTVNWMRALAILCDDLDVTFEKSSSFYTKILVRKCSEKELNTSFEQLLFSLHQISALKAIAKTKNKADVARIAIVAWYYAIYGSASAMIAVAEGSYQETHATTANQWDSVFASNNLVVSPFADRLSTILREDIQVELVSLRGRGKSSLVNSPTSATQGWGCVTEYLSGSAKWTQDNVK